MSRIVASESLLTGESQDIGSRTLGAEVAGVEAPLFSWRRPCVTGRGLDLLAPILSYVY